MKLKYFSTIETNWSLINYFLPSRFRYLLEINENTNLSIFSFVEKRVIKSFGHGIREGGIKFISRKINASYDWTVGMIGCLHLEGRRRLIAFINHAQPPIARSSALMRDLVGVYICHNVLPHRFAVAPHIRATEISVSRISRFAKPEVEG